MKIETKFNIGDNVYYLELGSEFVRESAISNIAIYKGFKKPYDVCYTISQYDGENMLTKSLPWRIALRPKKKQSTL